MGMKNRVWRKILFSILCPVSQRPRVFLQVIVKLCGAPRGPEDVVGPEIHVRNKDYIVSCRPVRASPSPVSHWFYSYHQAKDPVQRTQEN